MPRDIVHLQCTECDRRNYTATRNKRLQKNKLKVRKYCRFCRTHTVHKEV